MSTMEERRPRPDDADILSWRFCELVRAGFSNDQAFRLASEPQVDIRFAERLLAAGCPAETAQRILL
jgi:hypothetical protein